MFDELSPSLAAAAIIPALVVLWLVIAAGRRPALPVLTVIALGLGVLSAGIAIFEGLLHPIRLAHDPWLAFWASRLLFVAIPEEASKIAVIAAIVFMSRRLRTPTDGIIYGAAVGLGFAAAENLLLLKMGGADVAVATAIVRVLLSAPLHGALGVIAGAYLAKARLASDADSGGRWRLLLIACLMPVALHALFDSMELSGLVQYDPALNLDPEKHESAGIIFLAMLVMRVIIGIGTLTFVVLLIRRFAHQQSALPPLDGRPIRWRAVWALCLVGVGVAVVALTLVVPGRLAVNFAGWVTLVVALGGTCMCVRYLSNAERAQRLPPAA